MLCSPLLSSRSFSSIFLTRTSSLLKETMFTLSQTPCYVSSRPLGGPDGRENRHRHIAVHIRDARQAIALRVFPQGGPLIQGLGGGVLHSFLDVNDARPGEDYVRFGHSTRQEARWMAVGTDGSQTGRRPNTTLLRETTSDNQRHLFFIVKIFRMGQIWWRKGALICWLP